MSTPSVISLRQAASRHVQDEEDKRKRRELEDQQDAFRNLEILREHMDSHIYKMANRCAHSSADPVPFRWLHDKTFEETFRDDYGPQGKKHRTMSHYDALLALCNGDRDFFYVEYTLALEKRFPIPLKSFEWDPQLVKTRMGYLTVVHHWRPRRRVRKIVGPSDGDASDG